MVMTNKAMKKNLQRAILKSFGRYIALTMIIMLGAAVFIGLLMTKSDIVATGQEFMDQQNMYDIRLLTLYGWSKEHVEEIARQEDVESAEGVIYSDYIVRTGAADTDCVYRIFEIPETVNLPYLRSGRMPENDTECVVDALGFDEKRLGETIVIQENNGKDRLKTIRQKELTVVGSVASPLYVDMSRGTTTIGNGSITSFLYVPKGVLDLNYIPEIHVTLGGENAIYTNAYKEAMKAASAAIEPSLERMAEDRLHEVLGQAEEEYQEGKQELADAWAEYRENRQKANQELQDARQKLEDGEKEIADNEQKIKNSEAAIIKGTNDLKKAEKDLAQGRNDLADAKVTAEQTLADTEAELNSRKESLTSEKASVDAALAPIDAELSSVNAEISAVQATLAPYDAQISELNGRISSANSNISALQGQLHALGEDSDPATAASLRAQIAEQQAQIGVYNGEIAALQAQRAEKAAPLTALNAQKAALEAERAGYASRSSQLSQELQVVNTGIDNLPAARERVAQELAAKEASLNAAEADIKKGYDKLAWSKQQVKNGKAELEKAKVEVADGWEELAQSESEVNAEFRDALYELVSAQADLAEARDKIDAMNVNRSILLDRDSNGGYANLRNSANIVQGISRVFPVFFLLIAALVCITTITRMIDEERTEIGTLKALGYTNEEIISKYLFYSGSGALIGCVIGIIAGNTIFPSLLWDAYNATFCMQPDVVMKVNWLLCIAVAVVYIAILLLVTWYCCRQTLENVPSELIRPKAPDAGKALFVEKLSFWHKISFLNKVMIRNIFRYHQRLAMMLVGIGGCTALLLSGFGMQDSLVSVVDVQFEEVMLYDMAVHFQDTLTEERKTEFLIDTKDLAEKVSFCHQSTVNLLMGEDMREINMISTHDELRDFIDMHSGRKPVELPKQDEVVLTFGTAQELGIKIGDRITLRDADLREMTLTVSGIYDNHVYNYVIVAPETIEAHWGAAPDEQMALIIVPEGAAVHSVSAEIMNMKDVMDVSVSEDLAKLVESLLKTMEKVVVLVVVCAGMLAVIVLYNLTNINISERIREIATIKVLGFNSRETSEYIFKENMALTIVGSIIGLGLGWLLLNFVMMQIKVDTVCFKTILTGSACIWAVVLTILSAIVVDCIFYFKLQKINMAEALKSVE